MGKVVSGGPWSLEVGEPAKGRSCWKAGSSKRGLQEGRRSSGRPAVAACRWSPGGLQSGRCLGSMIWLWQWCGKGFESCLFLDSSGLPTCVAWPFFSFFM
ncbi:hypothetical protein AAFF_G00095020 [Aldrovandia affinis]|uniref:Uncharacterized protein n=1 Tax=Aldrovandia affinis TaxID=143900 RepID=A0AAD7RVX6_9TELE|nr:hypothetical protein AAFF_G00095020 [Aldrovandia affinis]